MTKNDDKEAVQKDRLIKYLTLTSVIIQAMKPLSEEKLQLPIDDLSLSDNFKNISKANGFFTLKQLLDTPLTELLQMQWFTNGMLEELTTLLTKDEIRNSEDN